METCYFCYCRPQDNIKVCLLGCGEGKIAICNPDNCPIFQTYKNIKEINEKLEVIE